MNKAALFLLLIGIPLLAGSQSFSGGFPFMLPEDDHSSQEFLPLFEPKEITKFLTINDSGNFFDGEKEVRFWGVNLTTEGNFPDKTQADYVASRMRKMGINLVRFHHMDNPWSNQNGTIFDRNTGGTRKLDLITLDRLHYFLSALKKQGIYANINLHVSRTFTEADGVAGADGIEDFGKAVTYYDPKLIQLQKEYATQLLTSTNPYTNLKLADDPVIGMVEITNENTIYGWWKGDRLRKKSDGGSLIDRHDNMLDDLWHDFLNTKYVDHNSLANAWETGAHSPGSQLIRDPGFESGNIGSNWQLELHQTANGRISADNTQKHSGQYSGKVEIQNLTPTEWHFQFKQEGLSMTKDSSYVIRFFAKADRSIKFNIVVQRGVDPWTYYGGTSFTLATDWKEYTFTISAPEENQNKVRVSFNFENTGVAWFDDFSMSLATKSSFNEGEQLALSNIERTPYSKRALFSDQRISDLAEFYITIQRDYYKDMVDFLKDQIGVKIPITGTNALVGPADVLSQIDLDYIDDHAYWDHPQFPSNPWDSYDWLINNESLLANLPGTIGNIMSGLALSDRPYTISEYNHPYPNRYQTEMLPLMAAYLSFHEVDGIMFFNYHDLPYNDWGEDALYSYFSINRNHAVMALMPVYGFAYRAGLIKPSSKQISIRYAPQDVYRMHIKDNSGRWGKYIPYDKDIAFTQSVKTESYSSNNSLSTEDVPELNTETYHSDQIRVNGIQHILIIDAPQIQSITGRIQNGTNLITQNLQINTASDFGQVGILSLDNQVIQNSSKLLLFIGTEQKNTNMLWDGNQTVHNNWGSPPSLLKPLQLNLTLALNADSIRIFPLSPTGAKTEESFLVYPEAPGRFTMTLDQARYKSPWFGVEVFAAVTSSNLVPAESIRISPNPAKNRLQVSWPAQFEVEQIELWDISGKQALYTGEVDPGVRSYEMQLVRFATGNYVIRLRSENHLVTKKVIISD